MQIFQNVSFLPPIFARHGMPVAQEGNPCYLTNNGRKEWKEFNLGSSPTQACFHNFPGACDAQLPNTLQILCYSRQERCSLEATKSWPAQLLEVRSFYLLLFTRWRWPTTLSSHGSMRRNVGSCRVATSGGHSGFSILAFDRHEVEASFRRRHQIWYFSPVTFFECPGPTTYFCPDKT